MLVRYGVDVSGIDHIRDTDEAVRRLDAASRALYERIHSLHQRVPGRPSNMSGGKKVNTYLDAESIAIATSLGNGNVSEGIRKALKIAAVNSQICSD